MNYRYHPESADLAKVCKLFEEKLTDALFGIDFTKDGLRLRAARNGYDYEQLLRNNQEPDQIVDKFIANLGPPKSLLILPY